MGREGRIRIQTFPQCFIETFVAAQKVSRSQVWLSENKRLQTAWRSYTWPKKGFLRFAVSGIHLPKPMVHSTLMAKVFLKHFRSNGNIVQRNGRSRSFYITLSDCADRRLRWSFGI